MADERRRDDAMQGGGYGGAQGKGGEGHDESSLGELQGGSYGRSWGGPAGASGTTRGDTAEGRREVRERGVGEPPRDADTAERERLARPPEVVDADGQAATIDDEGRSPDWPDIGLAGDETP